VTQLVKAGAIVLGKAVTTEFAGAHAGKTHNPHNLRHTPAGSSSGSAAAVADFMAPVGYGTQTAGSVIRPGAFNGVVAYKGSHGWADMTGIKAYAPSLDTLGFFAREANDLALIRAAYGHAPADPPTRAPRIGLMHTPWWDMAEAYNKKNIEEAARTLRAAGARVRAWDAPDSWANLMQAQHRIMTKEATQSYARERARFSHLFSPIMNTAMVEGDAVNRRQYADAKKRKRVALAQLNDAWEKFDLLLAPSARGEAPSGLGNTGDPIFNRFWTLLGTPCIALPFNTGPFGLPLSVQLIGPRGRDDQLIAWARWAERQLS
jgi:amidase